MTDMTAGTDWLTRLGDKDAEIDGLVRVDGYARDGRPPEEVLMMEKAEEYGAYAVFFEFGARGGAGVAQALVFLSDGPADSLEFGELHKRLWSWGGVPLVYRCTPGLIQLFRCAHGPDFISAEGKIICKPVKSLRLAAEIAAQEAWWDMTRLRNGTLWDDPTACKLLLSATKSAHRHLVEAIERLFVKLKPSVLLTAGLRRRLLILSLLIAYLEERGALPPDYFGEFQAGATRFFQILPNGEALVRLLSALESRFNGNVFKLSRDEQEALKTSAELEAFSQLIQAREEAGGQLNLWSLYSFRDLPVEVISHIYQLFVEDTDSSIYTPPALVRLMLDEAMSWSRIDRLRERGELIFDPACGSGVFLVEAYKRLVLHWRSRHDWAKPGVAVLRELLDHVRGVDVEPGAIELAAFSLCLALCDALTPEEIRASEQLFPKLADHTLKSVCFFEAKETGQIAAPIGVLVGNPPFESSLKTMGARRSYQRYKAAHGALADKQVAYLFLHESMELVAPGGVLCMLQQYNFIYNPGAAAVRREFFKRWDVREILDFVSIRNLFKKSDTVIVVVVAEAATAREDRRILHAVFRRGGRAGAELGFDIDYYDLHWLPRRTLLEESGPAVWRANLLGGARAFDFLKRLRQFPTIENHADAKGWLVCEGFAEGARGVSYQADHLIGKPLLPSEALTQDGIDRTSITTVPEKSIERVRTAELFKTPILLVREHEDLFHDVWTDHYLTYKNQIVGFAKAELEDLRVVDRWLTEQSVPLRAYVAGISGKSFTQKVTTISGADVRALPFIEGGTLDLSDNERIIAEDIVKYYRDFVRKGEKASVARVSTEPDISGFCKVFSKQINGIYQENPLTALPAQRWPGIICQPFAFGGEAAVDWTGADELRGKLDAVLRQQRGSSLSITRIARIYDGRFIFLLKPDRLRYWLRSTALRDSDDVLADLRAQGF